jgi:hypothetical protein
VNVCVGVIVNVGESVGVDVGVCVCGRLLRTGGRGTAAYPLGLRACSSHTWAAAAAAVAGPAGPADMTRTPQVAGRGPGRGPEMGDGRRDGMGDEMCGGRCDGMGDEMGGEMDAAVDIQGTPVGSGWTLGSSAAFPVAMRTQMQGKMPSAHCWHCQMYS